MTKVLSIVGARPQFTKVAVIASALQSHVEAGRIEHRILHTGQHYDPSMSECFFRELEIPEPDYHLDAGSGTHGQQTGRMLPAIESVLLDWQPDAVIVYGDTNSTLAGAVTASKLHIAVIHVEAGLRSFNRRMPEEINRIATDHLSDLLLCPTRTAMANLDREGLSACCRLTGDVMLDLLLRYSTKSESRSGAQEPYALITVHRAENTDDPTRIARFLACLERMPLRTVMPLHPRMRARLSREQLGGIERMPHVSVLPPSDYGTMLALERDAHMILTDSGGVQKEAYFLGVPCLTLRDESEWEETRTGGWNRLVGMEPDSILAVVRSLLQGNGCSPQGKPDLTQFGSGNAATNSVDAIIGFLGDKRL
jgi:UDP-GlcNAc3NAcA epimerase